MPVPFLSSLKWFLLFILHLILTAVFGWLTWAFWGLYQQEKLSEQYQREGQAVTVTVTGYSSVKQNWTDYLGNVKYLNFTYGGKSYNARYVQDTLFVSEGTKVPLLYVSSLDAFRQADKQVYDAFSNQSRLIGWTSASLLSSTHKALLAFLFVSVAFFFLLAGLLGRIPGLSFIPSVAGFVFTVLIVAGVVYTTYDAYEYYQYYHQVKDLGNQQTVTVADKGRYYLVKNDNNLTPIEYISIATVHFKNEERTIPVSESDYDRIKKGSELTVYYNAALNDMMATDYAINPLPFIFTGVLWVLLLFSVGNRMKKRRKKRDGLV